LILSQNFLSNSILKRKMGITSFLFDSKTKRQWRLNEPTMHKCIMHCNMFVKVKSVYYIYMYILSWRPINYSYSYSYSYYFLMEYFKPVIKNTYFLSFLEGDITIHWQKLSDNFVQMLVKHRILFYLWFEQSHMTTIVNKL
jgi:hypothetical protein